MRVTESSRRNGSRRWWLAILPIILMLAPIGLFFGNEFRAARSLRQEVAAIRAAGLPVDDSTLSQSFFNSTSQDRTIAWREVSAAINHLLQRAVGDYGLYDNTAPHPQATAAKFSDKAKMYLREAAPVIAHIDHLSQDVKPTWQPVVFSGFSTLLPDVQASRQIHRLLDVEFNHAIHSKDSNRALRALQLDAATSEAYDWQLCVVADMINIGQQQERHQRIRDSLAFELWKQEHLLPLSKNVGEKRDISRRWRRIFSNERAMYLTHVGADSGEWIIRVPPGWDSQIQSMIFPASLKLASLRQVNQVLAVADDGYAGLTHRARLATTTAAWPMSYRIVRMWGRGGEDFGRLTSSLLAGVENYAALCESFENSRRVTKTAIAVKQYRLRNNAWPDQLTDLESVGLSNGEWTAIHGRAFDYRVDPDQSQAVLSASDNGDHSHQQIRDVTIR